MHQLMRENGKETPVIILTEKSTLKDKVEGFTTGADDYLAKPFSHLELELRIQSLLRRRVVETPTEARGILKHCDLEIDFDRYTVRIKGEEITLTPIEFGILKLLASNPGRVYSRQELLNSIWDTQYDGYKRNIDPHVTRLRNKIENNPRRPKYVLTVWGVGYKFCEECPE